MLIELELYEKNIPCPLIDRIFLDTETGGISTMPVMAEWGQDKDSLLAQYILRCYKGSNHK